MTSVLTDIARMEGIGSDLMVLLRRGNYTAETGRVLFGEAVDTLPVCQHCGDLFVPHLHGASKFCTRECERAGATQRQRSQALQAWHQGGRARALTRRRARRPDRAGVEAARRQLYARMGWTMRPTRVVWREPRSKQACNIAGHGECE